MSVTSNPPSPFNSGNGSSTQTFPVTLSINGFGPWSITLSGDNKAPVAAPIALNPPSLSFDVTTGGAVPPPKTFTIQCAVGVAWETHDSGPWDLTGAPYNGTDGLKGAGPTTLTVKPNGDMPKLTATKVVNISVVSGTTTIQLPVTVNVKTGTTQPPPSGGNLPATSSIADWDGYPGMSTPATVGVVAFNSNGVQFVEFSINGGAWVKVANMAAKPPEFVKPEYLIDVPSGATSIKARITDGLGGVVTLDTLPLNNPPMFFLVQGKTLNDRPAATVPIVYNNCLLDGKDRASEVDWAGAIWNGSQWVRRGFLFNTKITQCQNGFRNGRMCRNLIVDTISSDVISDTDTAINIEASNVSNVGVAGPPHPDLYDSNAHRSDIIVYGVKAITNFNAQGISYREAGHNMAAIDVQCTSPVTALGLGAAGGQSNLLVRGCTFKGSQVWAPGSVFSGVNLIEATTVNGNKPSGYAGVTVR